jgi:hypothetical protein
MQRPSILLKSPSYPLFGVWNTSQLSPHMDARLLFDQLYLCKDIDHPVAVSWRVTTVTTRSTSYFEERRRDWSWRTRRRRRFFGLVIALRLQTPKHIRGGWSRYVLTPANQLMVMGLKIWSLSNSIIEPATFRSLAQHANQLRYQGLKKAIVSCWQLKKPKQNKTKQTSW